MWSVLSSETSERGRMSASLPMSKEMREVLSEEYYRDRKMQWMICAVDANGNVMRRGLCLESGGNWFWRLSERVEFCGGQAARSRVSSAIS